jgi:hypothetical protein
MRIYLQDMSRGITDYGAEYAKVAQNIYDGKRSGRLFKEVAKFRNDGAKIFQKSSVK